MKDDRQKMIIDIILNSNFFPDYIKREVSGFYVQGIKINKFELQHHYERLNKNNLIKARNSTTVLHWSNGVNTILQMINKDLIEFNWNDEICKYKENKANERNIK